MLEVPDVSLFSASEGCSEGSSPVIEVIKLHVWARASMGLMVGGIMSTSSTGLVYEDTCPFVHNFERRRKMIKWIEHGLMLHIVWVP